MKKDIFDRLMELPLLNYFEPFYKKNKEILLYIFFGCCTTLIGIIVFFFFKEIFKINELIADAISWVVAVTFSFVTNRKYVFGEEHGGFFFEYSKFASGRVLTLLLEELFIYIFITRLAYNSLLVKIGTDIIVSIINYFISKFFVFK